MPLTSLQHNCELIDHAGCPHRHRHVWIYVCVQTLHVQVRSQHFSYFGYSGRPPYHHHFVYFVPSHSIAFQATVNGRKGSGKYVFACLFKAISAHAYVLYKGIALGPGAALRKTGKRGGSRC